ncbi:Copia protein, partial [Termitomyces sp. J132]
PDLSFAIGLLARFQSNSGLAHWNALQYVLGYIKGTLDYKITYVSWSLKRQATITLSTMEAEYIAVTHAVQQALWMYKFLTEIDIPQQLLINLHVNNQSLITLATSTKGHSHTKHIDIRHHYICKCLYNSDITLTHVPSTKNIANLFTKPLP